MSATDFATIVWNRNRTERRPGQTNEGPGELGTYLVIPYFAGDHGIPSKDRPLDGSKAVSWVCPSIIVNGVKGTNTFQRGLPTTVTVDVANFGSGTTVAPVQVTVWWADPSTGFTTVNMFGQATVAVPTDGVARTSSVMTHIIPITAPPHVCLIARVSSPFDVPTPGGPIAPAGDRHWAQLNLNDISVGPGQPFQIMFWAGNPFNRPANFRIVAQAVTGDAVSLLGRHLHMDIVRTDNLLLQVADRRGVWNTQHSERQAQQAVVLESRERRPMTVTGHMPKDVEPGRAIAIEILQIAEDDREPNRLVGSIGFIVTAKERS